MSRACIIILAGYACVVRWGTAQDQALRFPSSIPWPNNIRVVKKISKIVLGLEVEFQIRDNPSLGVTIYICNFWGQHKQTNKQTNKHIALPIASDVTALSPWFIFASCDVGIFFVKSLSSSSSSSSLSSSLFSYKNKRTSNWNIFQEKFWKKQYHLCFIDR